MARRRVTVSCAVPNRSPSRRGIVTSTFGRGRGLGAISNVDDRSHPIVAGVCVTEVFTASQSSERRHWSTRRQVQLGFQRLLKAGETAESCGSVTGGQVGPHKEELSRLSQRIGGDRDQGSVDGIEGPSGFELPSGEKLKAMESQLTVALARDVQPGLVPLWEQIVAQKTTIGCGDLLSIGNLAAAGVDGSEIDVPVSLAADGEAGRTHRRRRFLRHPPQRAAQVGERTLVGTVGPERAGEPRTIGRAAAHGNQRDHALSGMRQVDRDAVHRHRKPSQKSESYLHRVHRL